MRVPNAERALIDPAKVRDYLLSTSHPVGRFKARFFLELGFQAESWGTFVEALREQHLTREAMPVPPDQYGQRFVVRAILQGPAAGAPVVSVWFVRTGEDFARFVTAYPGGTT